MGKNTLVHVLKLENLKAKGLVLSPDAHTGFEIGGLSEQKTNPWLLPVQLATPGKE